MKKTLSIILALALVMGLAIPAFAAEADKTTLDLMTTSEKEIEVNATYNDNADDNLIYSVDVVWEATNFTFERAGEATWDPSTHTYKAAEGEEVGAWDKTTAKVTVTNHSNAPVDVTIAWEDADEDDGVTASLDVSEDELTAGVENDYDNADKVESTLTIAGTPDKAAVEDGKLGTITVTIAAVSAG